MQNSFVGYFVINKPENKISATELETYFQKNMVSELYFVQHYEDNLKDSCRRTARLPIVISKVNNFPDHIENKCVSGNLCFTLTHKFNLKVNACQISEF